MLRPEDDPRGTDGVISRSFDAITAEERRRFEEDEKTRLKIEAKLTAKLQKMLGAGTPMPYQWELVPAHSLGGQGWSDFKSRKWGSDGRPAAVTPVEDVFVVAHFNENLFRGQYSFGVTAEKPPSNFVEVERELQSSVPPSHQQLVEEPFEYGLSRRYFGIPFEDLRGFGEAVIELRSAETE